MMWEGFDYVGTGDSPVHRAKLDRFFLTNLIKAPHPHHPSQPRIHQFHLK
jgi:hypothetical protein